MDALVRGLERFGPLCEREKRSVAEAGLAAGWVEADRDLAREGDRPSGAVALLDGWACRYRALEDGRRQITAFHLPGELCDLAGLHPGRLDQSTCTLTPAKVAPIPRATLLAWTERPGLGEALWRAALVDAAISREWVVNVGRRTAHRRAAHLLCELAARLRAAGLADGPVCPFPPTQVELADALGLTPVHVNRVLQQLRADGLAEAGGGALVVRDRRGLERAGGFDPAYLHLPGAAGKRGPRDAGGAPGRGPRKPAAGSPSNSLEV